MIDLKLSPTTKLFWVDLEMTDLVPKDGLILEVAAIITDFDFNQLATYESRVKQDGKKTLALMQKNDFWAQFPDNRDSFLNNMATAKTSEQVEQELIDIVNQQFNNEPAVLAGNSIYCDRGFIKQWWPKLDKLLHYRMLDVSSYKILMQSKYGVEYTKKENHRALGDIQESIAELKFYLNYFTKKTIA